MLCGLSPTLLFYPQSSQTLAGDWLSTMDKLSPSSSRGVCPAQLLHTCRPECTRNYQIHLLCLGTQSRVACKMLGHLPRAGNLRSSFPILAFSQRIWHALRTDCLKLLLIYKASVLYFCLRRQQRKERRAQKMHFNLGLSVFYFFVCFCFALCHLLNRLPVI